MGYIILIGCFLFLSIILLALISALRFIFKKNTDFRNFLVNFSLSGVAVLLLILIFELVFSHLPISDGFGCTLASRLWMKKYWNPINSYRIRDFDHDIDSLDSKKVLMVVGDSFVAGHGIKNYSDRFPNLLGKSLGPRWEVIILAHNGWETAHEFGAIRSYPHKPDVIILSYFINDIGWIAGKMGFNPPHLLTRPSRFASALIDKSYLLNFAYWRLYRLRTMGNDYLDYLAKAYSNRDIWKNHLLELQNIYKYTQRHDIKLIVVVWPQLEHIEETRVFTSQVKNVFIKLGVPVVDLSSVLDGKNSGGLTVNSLDAHPNEAVHREVAGLLFKELNRQ